MKMKFWLPVLFLQLLFVLNLVSAAPPAVFTPSQDDFYTVPDGFEEAKEGDILKIRKTPHLLRSIYFPVKIRNSWQVLVRSSDSFGKANVIVATIMEPFNADPSKLLSYQTAEDSSAFNCAPSYAFLYGASMDTIITQAEMFVIQSALERGWYVVSPDYEGFKSTFTVGKQSGHATLDGIRSALASSNITGINKDAEIGLYGYSGGSLASGWAAILQPTYAKELKLLGVSLGGFVTNITGTVEGTEGTIFAGLIANGLTGLANEYPQFRELMRQSVSSAHWNKLQLASESCLLGSLKDFAYARFFTGSKKFFKQGWEAFSIPYIQSMLDNNTLALHQSEGVPDIPMFIHHGAKDTIVPFIGAERVYKNWCDWGIKSLEFAVDESTGHITEIFKGIPAGIAWLEARFNGSKPIDGCKRTSRESNLDYPGVKNLTLANIFGSAAQLLLGLDIGPNGENITFPSFTKLDRFISKLVEDD